MKAKILVSLLLITAAAVYSFTRSENNSAVKLISSEDPPQTDFILGAMSNVFDNTMYNYLSDSLNFNMWHLYAGPVANYGWTYNDGTRIPADTLGADTNSYGPLIKYRITQNSQNDLMTLMTRPVITYFSYGQRSDYQMEESTKVDPYYFFYTYKYSKVNNPFVTDIEDNSQYGNGEYVKRCIYDRDSPGSNAGLIVSGLKGNKEQANTFWDVPYLGDANNDWYIMPRIRIDSVFANDPLNQEKEVCKIIITNWDGDSLTQILKVKNFKPNIGSIYNGDYLEEYFHYLNDSILNLIIPASNWFNPNQTDPFGNNDGQIDFKVYWYAKCDMWIDRIRVENEPARRLMTKPDENPYLIKQLEYEIKGIALLMRQSLYSNYQPYKFYIEEFEMNHLPSIGYVNKMIRDLTNDSMSLMVNYNYDLVKAFIPDSDLIGHSDSPEKNNSN
ncbi:MAG TPA: hypothetical protein PK536_08325 [Ignavibacteria bacterium]|nr:hypothetical protein [Bacteroidota bacterium]HRI85438.1 hypothetical protein [Ignavibacteria bacterium]HRJ99436.1 hypothetical protein [Ignavibacteria bacterium]